jgi:hypothetical protein
MARRAPLREGPRRAPHPRIYRAPPHGGPLRAAYPAPLLSSPWRALSSTPVDPVPSVPLHFSPLLAPPPHRKEEDQGEAIVRSSHW